ncbi:hypothetical protein GBAR_LOCUS10502 [Geodia barretti]|uniref:Uncharacterized protein n=1 Tax=Geodia barretti TaxID=519541 RepID=A0AA35WK17_GEOBA|nr:hypothetical protein GBAR_LOCUS10502 [Geodia barretti]
MIQRRAVTGEMADKENKVGQRNRPKPSRIPRPVSRARSKPLQPHNSVSQPSLPPPPLPPPPPPLSLPSPPPPLSLPSPPPRTRVSHTPSKVKPVPDFARLHKSFQEKITKAKEKKVLTEFKTFYLTPSSGKRNTTQPVEQEKKERKREGTVEVEYKETSQPPPDVCFDEISGPLVLGLPPALPFSPRQQIRLSVYSKTERALQRLLQSSSVVKQGAAHGAKTGQFPEMLQRLVQTTVSSIRTVSRCPETRDPGLDGVKVKLESQLECVEEEDEEGPPAPESPPHLLHSPPTFTRPRPPLPSNTADTAPPISVYTTEPELCATLWNRNNSPDTGRPSCPVARLLDQCYFLPVPNVVCRDCSYRLRT